MKAPWKLVDCRLAISDSPLEMERAHCPNHADDANSLMVYFDHCYCFGCQFRLARMETLAYLLFGAWGKPELDKAFAVAEKYTSEALDAYRQRVEESTKTEPLPRGLALAYHGLLQRGRQARIQWLTDRGLSWGIITSFHLGHDGTRFTIPVYDREGRLLTIRFRRDDAFGLTFFDPRRGEERSVPKYSGMPGRNGLFLFGAHPFSWIDRDWAVVVEGELDAIRLWQAGIPAVSPTNGAGNVPRVPALIKAQLPGVTRLFFATDQDEPGQSAAIEGVAAALREGFTATRLVWDGAKDVTELLLTGRTLDDATFFGDEPRLGDRPVRGQDWQDGH